MNSFDVENNKLKEQLRSCDSKFVESGNWN